MTPSLVRLHHLAGIIAAAVFFAAAAGAHRPDSSGPRSAAVKLLLLQKINAFSHENTAFRNGEAILYQRYPLSGNYPAAAFDAAAGKIEALFSRIGTVHEITVRKLGGCLLEGADSCASFRYLVTPCEMTASVHEQKMEIGSFVKLNREGDFVPTNGTRTIGSCSTHIAIRFVVVDLDSRTIVFDDRERATVSGDEAVSGLSPKDEKPGKGTRDQVPTGVMRVMKKIEAKLRKKP